MRQLLWPPQTGITGTVEVAVMKGEEVTATPECGGWSRVSGPQGRLSVLPAWPIQSGHSWVGGGALCLQHPFLLVM